MQPKINKPGTFFYFSYGEDLLTFRIHMYNPTAEFLSIARLDNYRLDFIKYSKYWGGPIATLVPTANAHVWGVIWRLYEDNMKTLDEQKGADIKKYYLKYVKVFTPYKGIYICRVYIQKNNPLPRGDKDEIPVEQWPSLAYKKIIIKGAVEHDLPEYYIKNLKKIKHNSEDAYFRTQCLLMRYKFGKPCECRVRDRIQRKPLKLDVNKIREERKIKEMKYI